LLLVAPLVLTLDHKVSPTGITLLATYKSIASAERADRCKLSATGRTANVPSLNLLEAIWAVVSKGGAGAALGAATCISFCELSAMDTRLLVSCHELYLLLFTLLFYEKCTPIALSVYRAFSPLQNM
jgi:hypothetical protein